MAGVWLKPEKGSEKIKAEKGLCVVFCIISNAK